MGNGCQMTIAGSVSRIAKALANSISSSETPLLERLSQEQGLVHPDFAGAARPEHSAYNREGVGWTPTAGSNLALEDEIPCLGGAEPRRAVAHGPSTVRDEETNTGAVGGSPARPASQRLAEMPTAPSQLKNHELARENYLMEISGCHESGDGSDENL